jgi:hypothetical protein
VKLKEKQQQNKQCQFKQFSFGFAHINIRTSIPIIQSLLLLNYMKFLKKKYWREKYALEIRFIPVIFPLGKILP